MADGPTGGHPAVAGREAEMRALADAVRRLIGLTVSNDAPPAETARAAADLHEVADRLARHVPPEPVSHSMASRGGGGPGLAGLVARMPFDVVVGGCSPLALPVELSTERSGTRVKAIGRGRFTPPYEGPPGCIHGAVIAATFDIVLTAANVLADAAGPTVSLTLRYHRPTLLHNEAVFEAWVDRTEGRRTYTSGRLVQHGVVTVEAEGVFVALDRETTRSLAQRSGRSTGPTAPGRATPRS